MTSSCRHVVVCSRYLAATMANRIYGCMRKTWGVLLLVKIISCMYPLSLFVLKYYTVLLRYITDSKFRFEICIEQSQQSCIQACIIFEGGREFGRQTVSFFVVVGLIFSWPWWRHQMEIFSALLALCAGNSPATGEFPSQRPVTRSSDVFFDLRPNKRLSKQWWGWWF